MNPGIINVRRAGIASGLKISDAPPGVRTLAERHSCAGFALNTRCGQRGQCAGCTVQLAEGAFRQRDGTVITAPAEVKACQGNILPGAEATIAVPARSIARHPPQVVTTFKLGVPAAHEPLAPVLPGVSDYELAIDIGTTTVVVALVDLATGTIVREESGFNRQIEIGDDVVTRIQIAGEPNGLETLRRAVVDKTVVPLVRRACSNARIDPKRLEVATVASNTTMLHLFAGKDPTGMGSVPFRPVVTEHRTLTAAELRFAIMPPGMAVHLLPGFSAYVRADLVAGCVCTGLLNEEGPSLLVDIGTNGEILLRHENWLLATATAAGSAFEGDRLAMGTRAVAGAVAYVAFPDEGFPPRIEVILGAARVLGLCGSAYLDFLAEARRTDLLDLNGRFALPIWGALPRGHRVESGEGCGVRLDANDSATLVTEADVAHLLQAKAAIAAGVLMLLRRAGITPADVQRVYLAGGFGLHLRVPSAIAYGLLPGFEPAQGDVVGNTSLREAWLAVVDRPALSEMSIASTMAEIVKLNLETGFEDTFIDQLVLA